MIMRLKDMCLDDRPREKMIEKGASVLSNAELIAILLRTGTKQMNVLDVARTLLKSADGSIDMLARMSLEELCCTEGVGMSKAVAVAAALELGRRRFSETVSDRRIRVSAARDVFKMMYPIMRDLENEECWVIYLNRANHCLGKERVSSGGGWSTVIDSKYIVRRALEKKASGIILSHNHPSGNATPSTADINMTRIIQKALKTCDLALVDHVVISSSDYYSFSDEILEGIP